MPYRLSLHESPATAVHRVAAEQLERAAAGLCDGDADAATAVHDARKHIKKTRALLRLSRSALPGRAYRSELRALRDAGRALSGSRDADAMLETVDKLAARYAGRMPATHFRDLRAKVAAHHRSRAAEAPLAESASALDAVAARAGSWPLDAARWADLRRDAARSYALGRKALAEAERRPTDARLHDWRKRVKDLWYHQRLLEEVWSGPVKAQAVQAEALSELLGDDHDLAVLGEFLDARGDGLGTKADLGSVGELIGARRAELQAEAIALGRRLYADAPKAYERRLAVWMRVAQRDAQVLEPA